MVNPKVFRRVFWHTLDVFFPGADRCTRLIVLPPSTSLPGKKGDSSRRTNPVAKWCAWPVSLATHKYFRSHCRPPYQMPTVFKNRPPPAMVQAVANTLPVSIRRVLHNVAHPWPPKEHVAQRLEPRPNWRWEQSPLPKNALGAVTE